MKYNVIIYKYYKNENMIKISQATLNQYKSYL
jgi:hypothetical protein